MSALPPNTPLICPTCVQQSQTSTIALPGQVNAPTQTISQFIDSQGLYHIHDPNSYINSYTCSLGHTVTQLQTIQCMGCLYNH